MKQLSLFAVILAFVVAIIIDSYFRVNYGLAMSKITIPYYIGYLIGFLLPVLLPSLVVAFIVKLIKKKWPHMVFFIITLILLAIYSYVTVQGRMYLIIHNL